MSAWHVSCFEAFGKGGMPVARGTAVAIGASTLAMTFFAMAGGAGETGSTLLLAITAFVALTLTGAPRPG
jgi:hypothetical protein